MIAFKGMEARPLASAGAGPSLRRLLYTGGQVHTIEVTLTAGETLLVNAFRGADFAYDASTGAGSGTLTFQDLPPGRLTVAVKARTADGTSIGSASTEATIESGRTVTADIELVLDDTRLPNPRGGLHAHVTLQDGDVVEEAIAPPAGAAPAPLLAALKPDHWKPAVLAGAYTSLADGTARTIDQDGVLFTIGPGAEMAGSGHFVDGTHLAVAGWTGAVDEQGAITWKHPDPLGAELVWEPRYPTP
jgi:hypothetical protein